MLSTGCYLFAVGELALLLGGVLIGAVALRRRLLGGWQGAPAWLATAVLATALLLWLAELLGAVGLFREGPLVLAALALGGALRLALPSAPPEVAAAPPSEGVDPGRPLRLAGIAVAAVAVAHFTIGVRLRLSTGMTGFDSTWYHGPFAAGFAQSGETLELQLIAPQFLSWFYPQSSELLHGVGIALFDRDLLSPLLNLGWLFGCLGAAWCIGRPYGAAPVSLAAAAVLLDTGALADQAGEARNDLMATFFLLAALALAVNAFAARRSGDLRSAELAVIGLAAGIALGTKLNFVAPALVLLAGLALLAPPGRRARALVAAGLPLAAAGGFWYLRNLVHAGNPLPWFDGLGLPAPDQPLGGREGHSAISYLLDGSIWSEWFLPGLSDGFGVAWPALLVLAVAGIVLALGPRSEPALRLSGAVAAALLLAWLVAPTGASGPEGEPRGFLSGLRYLAPALVIGAALLPTVPAMRGLRQRWALLGALAVLLPFADASAEPWHSAYLLTGLAVGALVAAAGVLIVWRSQLSVSRAAVYAAAAALALAAIAAGERAQRTYLANRYADPGFSTPGLDAAFRWARSVEGATIATTATRSYPLYGADLSNRVRFVGVDRPHGGFVLAEGCRQFVDAVSRIGPDYLVVSLDRLRRAGPSYPPEVGWTARSAAARELLRLPPTAVFEISGRLEPDAC